ncbi:MAG: NAD(P)-dependent glycerol-3-phosphate dehydrogenase [Hyphomicrobiaceae bacterium]|nr:NAD(P)-dependent glycerol-3-phosphate dehydrogenase [Hyphomicrobiaceae bacterium]
MAKIGVVGSGAWGTALAAMAARGGHQAVLWSREQDVVDEINQEATNRRSLPGAALPEGVSATLDADTALKGADAVLFVVPAQATRAVAEGLVSVIAPGTPVLTCSKGIEQESGRFMSEVLAEVLPEVQAGALSGPSFAVDVVRGLPTAVTVAASGITEAERLAALLSAPTFRPYASDDLIGVEIGGALKNVLAIAAGAVAGRGLGKSAEAAVIARGFAELSRFGQTRGARGETLMGLSGLGDLVLTCSSPQSRNYAFGMALGAGETVDALLAGGRPLAEGAHTASVLAAMAVREGIDMPIAGAVAAVLSGRLTIDAAIDGLLQRPLKREGL